MNEIVEHRAKMVQSVEDGSLNRVATATFGHLAEGKGTLTWNNGAIPQFITQVLDHFGLHPPPSGQVYQLYTAFDRDKNGSLSLSESLRLVEAIVRAAFNIKTESARLNTSTSSVLPTSPSGPGLPSAPSGPPSVLYPVGSSATTPAPPLAQLATQALPVPSGAPVMPSSATRGYRLAQEWIEGYSVQPLTQTTMAYTPRRKPVDIADFTSNFHDTAEANAPNISRIKASLENLSLLKEALELFRACDRERRGYLSWEAGEIQSFISRVFMKQGLVPPRQEQIRSLFAAFDLDGNGRLEPRECVCMVDALARAIILAQPRSMQARAMGTLTVPAYSLAEQWLADYRPPAVLDGQTVHYPLDRSPVDLSQLAVHLRSVVPHNARHKARMIGAIESGEFLKEALRLFKECDTDRNGQLTWNEREIPKFIAKVFRKYDLMEPKEAQLYEIYRYYDGDQSYSLDVRESLCLADAVVRAMYLDSEGRSPQSRCSNRVSFSAEVSPVHSAGSHIERRRMLSDEEAARRVALQEAAMEQRFEHLMRRCNESIKERDTMAALYVVLGAWRQFAVHELAARMKEEWKLKLAEAEKKLREEQQSFQNRLEDELDRLQRTRALDTSTSVVSAVGYAEAAAQAEEEAEKRFQKERHLWEARCKEERQRRESLQAAQAAALANAANEAEKSAEARFEEERELYEQRLKEEREKRNRAEAAKAQALDHYMAEVRTQKKNAVQKVIDSLFPKTRDRAASQLKNIASSWLSLAKAGARRRRRVGAIDKAVMSWGRKAMSGRPGPSFNAWRDVLRAKRRAHAAMGVLERQWLGGSRAGLAASYLAEWRRALDQKRQMALKAKRRSKAHAQVSLLLAQWERGRAAGLITSYLSAWKRVADAAARIRARGSRAEAVQLALQKWQRGSSRGLLHEALRLWHKLCGRRRQALLVSQSLVAWEQQAEVGLVHTCFAAWLKMVLAAKREHGKQQQTEAVTLALQKWERGNKQGLLHEVLDQWYKLFVPRSRQAALLSNYLVSWEVEAEVGLLQTCAAAWRKLADGAARQRFRERSREAVHLAMEKWALGNEKGLLHEILDLWHKSCASRKRQAQLIAKCLTGMEEKSLVGLLHTCFLAWWKVGNAELQHHRKERSREAVQLVLQKWMRGKVQGLLHETLDQWHHLCVNKAQRDLLVKRYLTSWEMETQVGLAQTCLTSWKKLADALARQRSKEHGHEAVKLALQKWERGNTRGLLHEVLQEWFGLGVTHRRQAALASRYLMSWEGQSQVAIRQTCFASWRELAHAAAKLRAKQRGREAVHLAVQKWERGNVSGLLHEIMTLWQKLSATRRHRAGLIQSCMVSWRQRTEGGLLSTSLSAWRQLVEATVRQRTKERGRESIQLALQKWERGNVQGLLHEVVGQWHHLCSDRRQRAKLLGRSLLALEGHAQGALSGTILACWRQVSQAESRKRAKEHSHEAVTLALQKWERGNVSGLLHEVLHQWQKLFAGRRQKAKLLSRYLVSMEAQAGVGLLGSFHALWKQQVQVEKRQRAKEHSHEAVTLALQKWERGNVSGLLHEVLHQWQKLFAGRRQKAKLLSRYLVSMEAQAGVGLLGSFHALWKQQVQVEKRQRAKEHGREAVRLALQKWERGNERGLLTETLSEWHRIRQLHKAEARRERSHQAVLMMLQTWRRPGPQGIAACAISAWARLAAKRRGRSRAAASMERQVARFLLARTGAMRQAIVTSWRQALRRSKARGSVELVLRQMEAGKSAGLMGTVLGEWNKVRRRQKAHSSLELILRQWESGFAKGLQTTVLAEWQRLALESKRELKHQRAHAVVELTLSQWEKGQRKGLMATVVKDWHKYAEVSASNGRKVRGAGTLEEKLLLATLRLCLHGWRGHLGVVRARASAKELHESMEMQRLNLVFVLWRLCNMEEKKEQAFGQVAEISAIAYELQQAQTSLLEEKILLEGKVEKAFEALQKELQTKEELAAELREAYSKQASRSALLPDLPANLTLSPGALTHSFRERVGADIAASIASASMNVNVTARSREGTPRADADDGPKFSGQRRTKVSPRLPGVSRVLNGTAADTGPSSELDWNAACPRIEELMKNLGDGETPKAASAIASRGETAERFEALGRAIEQEDGLPGRVNRTSPRSKSPTALAAERRRRKAAQRAGMVDDGEEWV